MLRFLPTAFCLFWSATSTANTCLHTENWHRLSIRCPKP